jgi:hypothetical protein
MWKSLWTYRKIEYVKMMLIKMTMITMMMWRKENEKKGE